MPSFSNFQPSLALTTYINTSGIFSSAGPQGLARIHTFAGNFVVGGADADGSLRPIAQNTALFSLLGTTYGGNGQTTFALPDLDGRVAVGVGQGPGLANHVLGDAYGAGTVQFTQDNLPIPGQSPDALGNEQPSLPVRYLISQYGVFPSPNIADQDPYVAEIVQYAGYNVPDGYLECNGQLLTIAGNQVLFALLGTTYGGDGVITFALPDLRGRTAVGTGISADTGQAYVLGQTGGSETLTISQPNMPTNMGGSGVPLDNQGPYLAVTFGIAIEGIFPSPDSSGPPGHYLGEVVMFASNYVPRGYLACNGQLLSIAQNQALFSLLGTTYGGNGITTFALPDLRGRSIIGSSEDYWLGSVVGGSVTLTSADMPPLDLLGTAANDSLYGGDQADILNGAGGGDVMTGGKGDDTYYVNATADVVIELANQGYDTVYTTTHFNASSTQVEQLILTGTLSRNLVGNALDNVLRGNSGDNVLDGGAGADRMEGGAGNDTYYVERAADLVVEKVGEGIDTVYASSNHTLAANVENGIVNSTGNRTLTGNALNNTLTGNVGNDTLNGGDGADTLKGGAGNDILDGGAGSDVLIGGLGDDTYRIDSTADSITELAGQGTDTVQTTISFNLEGTNVENATLIGTLARNLVGSSGANVLIGNSAANTLAGAGGADVLTGGAGADRFDFNAVSDTAWNAYDTITDLTNSDIIDLSTIDANANLAGNQAFVLVNAFTGQAGQLRLVYSSTSGDTYVQGDIDGDGVGDFRIRLSGDHRDYDNFVL